MGLTPFFVITYTDTVRERENNQHCTRVVGAAVTTTITATTTC